MNDSAHTAIWCVIPVKGFARAKSRLSTLLTDAERATLARDMFAHVHAVCARHHAVEGVLIATDDPDVAELITSHQLPLVVDAAGAQLGGVVDRALSHAVGFGATHAIVVMSDLPCLVTDDIDALIDAADGGKLVIAPDRARLGTNALLLGLPAEIATCFGRADSFAAHLAAAASVSAPTVVVERPGLGLDLDTPDDYATVLASLG